MKRCFLYACLGLLANLAQAAGLTSVNPEELLALQHQGALVVDVRTPEEWQKTGLIPGSQGLTFFSATGSYDQEAWLKQLKSQAKSPDQPIVLVCASGNRSALVGKMLAEAGGFSHVYHLGKGIRVWNAENRPLENGAKKGCC